MGLKELKKKNTWFLKKEKQKVLIKNSISMIKKYLIIFLTMSTLTCSQKKNNDNTNINKTMNKSVNTIIDSFKEKPYYHIKVKSSGVNFDIRINDLPIFRFFGESGGTNIEYPINTGILETGEQILTIKILPIKGKKIIAPENTFTLEINKKVTLGRLIIKEKLY
ncbi:hypothetical protein AX766_01210 [Flavobacterium covae]|nr:hypothetical protein AX766_01210 [Flavobacterium covae]